MSNISREDLHTLLIECQQTAQQASRIFRLPVARHFRHGESGSMLAQGVGSSLEFHDHREYHPGDDVRHLDWNAYARTGNYVVKLFRAEFTPRIDVIVDVSASMTFALDKARRSFELVFFTLEQARRMQASIQWFFVDSAQAVMIDSSEIYDFSFTAHFANQTVAKSSNDHLLRFDHVKPRSGALSVVISDLLIQESPEHILKRLVRFGGRTIFFAPVAQEECEPEWSGNVQFIDCETERERQHLITNMVLEHYRERYNRHRTLWQSEAERHHVQLAWIPSEEVFDRALKDWGLPLGVVELCN